MFAVCSKWPWTPRPELAELLFGLRDQGKPVHNFALGETNQLQIRSVEPDQGFVQIGAPRVPQPLLAVFDGAA